MSDEEAPEAKKANINNLFDDSDDSDSDKEESNEAAPAKTDNAKLFGSDSDDSDEDMDMPNASSSKENVESKDAKPDNTKLFGSDSDDSDSDDDEKPATQPEKNTESKKNDDEDSDAEFNADSEIQGRKRTNFEQTAMQAANAENDDGEKVEPSNVTVPDMPLPQFEQKGNKTFHMVPLPKIVSIQNDAFNPDTYNGAVEETQYKGHTNCMIRWRYKKAPDSTDFERDDSNKLVKESNARIIKWSDGSYGLRIGDEIFDMDESSFLLNAKKQAKGKGAVVNQGNAKEQSNNFLYLTQKAQMHHVDGTKSDIGTILQCVTSLKSKFIPRPASLQSAAHKNFALKERSRVIKRAQIQEFVTFVDPEKEKAQRIQNKEDLMKQEKRSGKNSGGYGGGGGGGRRRMGMHRAYMDEDDDGDYDTVNIRNLKKRSRGGYDEDMDYGDDDMSDEEDVWSKRKQKRFESGLKEKHFDDDAEDEEEEFNANDDDDDEEIVTRKKPTSTPQKKANIFDDDDDSD